MSTLQDVFKLIPEYQFEIGVFSTESKRKEKVRVGLTNAELMFIHEHGSPLHSVPARPVLQMTLEWGRSQLSTVLPKAVELFFKEGEQAYKRELDKFALRLEKYARNIIYSNDGRLASNAPSTIARKGDNHPLFDTGQLARSITCQAVKV